MYTGLSDFILLPTSTDAFFGNFLGLSLGGLPRFRVFYIIIPLLLLDTPLTLKAYLFGGEC